MGRADGVCAQCIIQDKWYLRGCRGLSCVIVMAGSFVFYIAGAFVLMLSGPMTDAL